MNTVGPKPRKANIWVDNGKPMVSLVQDSGNVKAAVRQSLELLGGLGKLIRPGDTITLKPNFNSDDPFPASTDLGFLRAVIELVKEAGAGRIVIGESAGILWVPTTKVVGKMGYRALAQEMGVELVLFDEVDQWVEVETGGRYLPRVSMAKSVYEADKMIYLPCMKTHQWARFTLALKLAVGFTRVSERMAMHRANLEEKVAEINLAWQPDLIIMDGRKSFITGGPESGHLAEPRVIMASGDLVAIDVEALRLLQSYRAQNRLDLPLWEFPQIKVAAQAGLGVKSEAEYVVKRG